MIKWVCMSVYMALELAKLWTSWIGSFDKRRSGQTQESQTSDWTNVGVGQTSEWTNVGVDIV